MESLPKDQFCNHYSSVDFSPKWKAFRLIQLPKRNLLISVAFHGDCHGNDFYGKGIKCYFQQSEQSYNLAAMKFWTEHMFSHLSAWTVNPTLVKLHAAINGISINY